MGDSPKWVKSKRRRGKKRRERERLNNGDNNGQATHGARKPPGPKIKIVMDSQSEMDRYSHYKTHSWIYCESQIYRY